MPRRKNSTPNPQSIDGIFKGTSKVYICIWRSDYFDLWIKFTWADMSQVEGLATRSHIIQVSAAEVQEKNLRCWTPSCSTVVVK